MDNSYVSYTAGGHSSRLNGYPKTESDKNRSSVQLVALDSSRETTSKQLGRPKIYKMASHTSQPGLESSFRFTSANDVATPKGVQVLKFVINNTPHSVYYVYTDHDNSAASQVAARSRILHLI
ncbi:hypothetical protein WG66_010749 [Moniliophthora roreri]|uniref:Putative HET-domain-containing protein n=1 Tax=Moniliophthora roreri TaxID=221103 RepID=A0A0W0G217_MONRR|nr:hypothetical protein WG66_010749 [Moniliophthora roreri]